ncbi:MAG: phytoene desaturase family protein, partial [Bacilli bacterium]
VTLFERRAETGGKLQRFLVGDATFDFGPNTITMPEVFRDVLRFAGEDPDVWLTFQKLDVHTRNYFHDGSYWDWSTDRAAMHAQLGALDPFFEEHYDSYVNEISRLYGLASTYFFPRTFSGVWDYCSPSLGGALMRARPLQRMSDFHKQYARDPRVLQALNRFATYVGSHPERTPATFAMIAALEFVDGVYYSVGGNARIRDAFVQVAERLGVTVRTGTEIVQLVHDGRSIRALRDADGQVYDCDWCVLNGDLHAVLPGLLSSDSGTLRTRPASEPTSSAFVALLETNRTFAELRHHTVFFPNKNEIEYDALFSGRYSAEPNVYICTNRVTEPGMSPNGDNLFVLVNAPSVGGEGDTVEPVVLLEQAYSTLRRYGLDVAPHVTASKIVTPKQLESNWRAWRGALYGEASHSFASAFLRPPNFSSQFRNLAFVGGSTHPGGGSPLVTMSGRNVAFAIGERASRKR